MGEIIFEYKKPTTPQMGEKEKLLRNIRKTTAKLLSVVGDDDREKVTSLADRLEQAITERGRESALSVLQNAIQVATKTKHAQIKRHYRLAA